MEYINATQVSPLISKGVCKVCWVGQQPNRNHTIITKELATEMGRKLPGSPVVGYFNKDTKDFDGHNREIIVEGGKYEIVDVTRPYGFVPTDSTVWFEKFNDEGVEHEYLCCYVYIWTGAYPESKRILENGNNQSMELTNSQGSWTNDDKTNARIFIYNEALIEKLCVLGENVEPCFEGAQVKSQFSLESSPEFQEFKATMFSMLNELQETLNKGGSQQAMENENPNVTPEVNEQENEFKCGGGASGGSSSEKKDEKKPEGGSSAPEEKKDDGEKKPEEDKKKKYDLSEVTEYAELMAKYVALQNNYTTLQQEKATLNTEIAELRQFRLTSERQSKQAMIDSFYMLSDEDKKDVVEHIDTYSLGDIEAKLSILCVRNKVNFNLEPQEQAQNQQAPQGLFNLQATVDNDGAPAWVKAIRETARKQ